jgi:hypothetical protein
MFLQVKTIAKKLKKERIPTFRQQKKREMKRSKLQKRKNPSSIISFPPSFQSSNLDDSISKRISTDDDSYNDDTAEFTIVPFSSNEKFRSEYIYDCNDNVSNIIDSMNLKQVEINESIRRFPVGEKKIKSLENQQRALMEREKAFQEREKTFQEREKAFQERVYQQKYQQDKIEKELEDIVKHKNELKIAKASMFIAKDIAEREIYYANKIKQKSDDDVREASIVKAKYDGLIDETEKELNRLKQGYPKPNAPRVVTKHIKGSCVFCGYSYCATLACGVCTDQYINGTIIEKVLKFS